MNSYKKLINNSVVFAVGTLGSRLISLILVPLYTYYLTTAEYGTVDLIITTVNMLIPIVSVSVFDAVLRFVLDTDTDTEAVMTNSLFIAFSGFVISLLFIPVFSFFNVLGDNIVFLYLILLVQMVERILAQYTRASGKVKIFATNGILLTFLTGLFNILFLAYFNLGVLGYFGAIILSYSISILYLSIMTKVHQDINLKSIKKETIKELMIYTVPLVPNSIMWWLINASSRMFITAFIDVAANGLFAVASRIPSVLTILYQVFNRAWQLSAIEEFDNKNNQKFYSNVFNNLFVFMFLSTSIITVFIKPIFSILFDSDFYIAWQVAPFLLIGAVFSSFSSFLGTFYITSKETKGEFKTSIYAGIISIVLNILLISTIGIVGAGISSMVSFFSMFIIRNFDTKKYIDLNINWKLFISNLVVIGLQVIVLFLNQPLEIELAIEIVLFLGLILVNRNFLITVFNLVKKIIQSKLKRK